MAEQHRTVYVVTDLGETARVDQEQPDPRTVLVPLVRQLVGLAVVVVPILATTGLLVGLLLGWSPTALGLLTLLGLPIIVNLVDLFGARVGWPPLSWVAAEIADRYRTKD
ncbi:hypothetical protein [Streptosporangium canum]|uniref:hypothetical protein n=1 Tax=Streptosporangium canum TaxID=324952 RepID=UPI0037A4D86D